MAWCLDTVSVAWIKRAATKDYRDWILAWLILSIFLIATPSWRWGAESVKNPWLLASLCLSEKELAKSFRQMSISPRLTWGQRIEMLSLLCQALCSTRWLQLWLSHPRDSWAFHCNCLESMNQFGKKRFLWIFHFYSVASSHLLFFRSCL